MRTAVFLQARLSSQRLPHKILLNLGGRTVLEQTMLRLNSVQADYHVVLTDRDSFPIVRDIAFKAGWGSFKGPGNDVLARYIFAARHYGVDVIVRATADNPLVSFELANVLIESQFTNSVDYRSHIELPYGAGVEIIRTSALEKAFSETQLLSDHEHVTPYVYNNPDRFTVRREQAPPQFANPDLRITLDNEEDYRFLCSLYRNYGLKQSTPLSDLLGKMYPVMV